MKNLRNALTPSRDKQALQAVFVLVFGAVLYALSRPAGVVVGLTWLLPVLIGIHLGQSRDRAGWMWGLFLSWLGVLILACMRPQPRA